MPIHAVRLTTYGVGVTVDIQGNVRMYDMYRGRKIAKVSCSKQGDVVPCHVMPVVEVTHDSFLIVMSDEMDLEVER